ncbi:hypothetical protein OE88DRAFT_1560816 [Heliocybe sulcata]|uniref:Aminoglycoside phosphotransferase domain-containing protein n=1 Tax=Heliocybe sulcata TaxID=5364 RepID=A0A5C3N3J7_9AGAM|nr:hypothetical protein OE88DRAFT_1560816 [Heliocybe sulcata]
MPLHVCDFASCRQPSVRKDGACRLCERRLCAIHNDASYHDCPSRETDESRWNCASDKALQQEISSLLSSFQPDALQARASELRGGIPCTLEGATYDSAYVRLALGGMNYHLNIRFQDDVYWICRLRRQNASSSPPQLQERIVLSEVATLQYLASAGIPVPIVYDYAVASRPSPLGVSYIIMERLSGEELDWYSLGEQRRRRFLSQFADIVIKLRRHPFPLIGCLANPGDPSVGPLLADNTADAVDGELDLVGPFSSWTKYQIAIIDRQLDLISHREAYPRDSVEAYLVHRYLRDYIATYSPFQDLDRPAFFLRHMDDKGDHILIDDDGNITGIIDWEWAQTTCEAQAFCAPFFLLDIVSYYDGSNELSEYEEVFAEVLEEKGSHDLAAHVRNGRLQHRLLHCIAGDIDDRVWFPNLFAGLLAALQGRNAEDPKKMWLEWKASALDKYQHEERLRNLIRSHPV